MRDIPESDWKYMRSLQATMLEELSRRINDELREILHRAIAENEKRRLVYDHVMESDRIVAACFDDWRRSRAVERCWALRRAGLITDDRLGGFTATTQESIRLSDTL
jgi:hypothetical protein